MCHVKRACHCRCTSVVLASTWYASPADMLMRPSYSYFTEVKAKRDAELLVLPTDAALYEDEGFR